MFCKVIRFFSLLSVAILVGVMCAVWLEGDPGAADPAFYIQFQQHRIGALNTIVPLFGMASLLFTIAWAFLERDNRARAVPIAVAIPCLIAAALITRFLNQPINAQVMTWTRDVLPPNWAGIRADWWLWHDVRTLCGIVGLASLIIAGFIESPRRQESAEAGRAPCGAARSDNRVQGYARPAAASRASTAS